MSGEDPIFTPFTINGVEFPNRLVRSSIGGRYAYYDGTPVSPEDNFGGPPNGWPGVGYACNQNQNGNCTPVVPNSTSQDFSWMLGLMPANGAAADKAAKPAAKPPKKAGSK